MYVTYFANFAVCNMWKKHTWLCTRSLQDCNPFSLVQCNAFLQLLCCISYYFIPQKNYCSKLSTWDQHTKPHRILSMYSRKLIAKMATTTFVTKFFYALIFYGLSIFNLFTTSYTIHVLFLTVLLSLMFCMALLYSQEKTTFFMEFSDWTISDLSKKVD